MQVPLDGRYRGDGLQQAALEVLRLTGDLDPRKIGRRARAREIDDYRRAKQALRPGRPQARSFEPDHSLDLEARDWREVFFLRVQAYLRPRERRLLSVLCSTSERTEQALAMGVTRRTLGNSKSHLLKRLQRIAVILDLTP